MGYGNSLAAHRRDFSQFPPRVRTVNEMTADDIQKKAEKEIEKLKREIENAKKRIPVAEKELEYWKRVAGR